MMVYKDLKTLVNQAIDRLNKAKKINLTLYDFIEDIFKSGLYHVSIVDDNGWIATASFYGGEIIEPRKPDEPQNISIDNLQVIRIAKKIWDAYKEKLQEVNTPGSVSNTVNGGATIGSVYIDPASISGTLQATIPQVDALEDRVRDLEQKNQELKDELNALKDEVNRQKPLTDLMLAVLQDKGIL